MVHLSTGLAPRYDVVVALNYYSPYVSGVTEAARVTAEGLAARGWSVLVICGRHDPASPRVEHLNGVDVLRTKVVARIGKGIISPTFAPTVARWARRAKLVHLHAPMLEAGGIATLVGAHTPIIVTYQCDVALPPTVVNTLQMRLLDRSHIRAFRRARSVVVSSEDYVASSRLRTHLVGRTVEIPPPSLLRPPGEGAYRDGPGLHVGFLGRIVEEKGLEYLIAGFRELGSDARLIIGGDFSKIAGGSVIDKITTAVGDDPRIRMLGFVPAESMSDFYASLDLFALTSVNSLEAFGIVQVEAMMLGIPALASDLPGVRVPVSRTGFGHLVAPRDSAAITAGLRHLAAAGLDRTSGAAATQAVYLADRVIEQHVTLFSSLLESP
jgi:glycosyltransferase involved in cell wall biosynthesis